MRRMSRRWIAAVWVAGATLPLLLATAFVAGCCILPFHGVMHKLMPVCHMAASPMQHDGPPAAPAREKEEPAKRLLAPAADMQRLTVTETAQPLLARAADAPRNFLTHGAVRCDQDVGLHVFASTFRI